MPSARPKVLSIFGVKPSRIGGVEIYARELSTQLAQHGWDSVLCFADLPRDLVSSYLAQPNVSVDVAPHCAEQSFPAARQVWSLIRRHRPEILHLQFTPFISPHAWSARLSSVSKVFFTDQGSRPEGFVAHAAPAWKRMIAHLITAPVTNVIGISDYVVRCARTTGLVAADRVTRIYNATDISRAAIDPCRRQEFRNRHQIPQERTLVTQVSWIIPEKGILDFLEAARLAVAQEPALHFALAGEGKYRPEYSQKAIEMGIGPHVTWLGMVQDPFGEGLYAATDILCQMSRWEEAFGWVIAEAMTFGIPVIATNVGGIPEVVDDGVTGFLVPRGGAATTTERILDLARDPSLRKRLGTAGKAKAQAEFEIHRNVASVLKLYGILMTSAE